MEKKRIKKIDDLCTRALNDNVFSGAAIAFSKWNTHGYERFNQYYGFYRQDQIKKKLVKYDFFDLASLTKPLSTVLVLLALFETKIINNYSVLGDIFPNCPRDKRKISIKKLMSHSAGFKPHRDFFYDLNTIPEEKRKEYLLKRILNEKLRCSKDEGHCYSDLGFMLLALLIKKITGKELDVLSHDTIYTPLELQNDLVFPKYNEKANRAYVETGSCLWSDRRFSGLVHDDNCRAMGGVAGHAGLFGTLTGVMSLCEKLLDQWKDRGQHPAYSNKLLQETLSRVGRSSWTMGFDMVSSHNSSAGNYFSEKSVGHLGFTGTSFWIDLEKECIVVLLTNRVCYGTDNWQIKTFRPALHDLFMKGQKKIR